MNFKILKKTATDVEAEFILDAKEWETAVDTAYEKEKGKYALQGFRKGKVPKKMLEKNYGDDMFYEAAINLGFSAMYSDFLKKNKDIVSVEYPELAISKVGVEGLTLHVEIILEPSLKIGAYKGLGIEVKKQAVEAKAISAELDKYREKVARIEEADVVSKKGSIVDINFKGFVDDVAFAGGEAENYDLELGSNSFIPGFEDQLIGTKKGDEKDVVVTFPKEYQADLAGKKATFKIKVNAVKEKVLPELNDEFAKDVSTFNTLAELKADITTKLEAEQTKKSESVWQQEIVNAIVAGSEFTISKKSIDNEANYILQDLEQNLSYQGLNMQTYCQYLNTDMKALKEKQIVEAEKLIKMRLVFNEIIKLEKIDVTKADCIALVKKQNKNSNFDDAAAEKYFEKISAEKKDVIKNDTIVDKLINFLKTNNLK